MNNNFLDNLKHKGNTYIIGSRMYGLDTPDSDTDTLTIYWDRDDYVSVFKEYPEVKEYDGNNTKLFALQHFALLLAKGNPNLVEIVNLEPEVENNMLVTGFMAFIKSNPASIAHKGVAQAYMGHLNGILKELVSKGITPKRLSHALRVAYSLNYLLKNKQLINFKDHRALREDCLRIKLINPNESYTLLATQQYVTDVIRGVENVYEEQLNTLPDNKELKDLINQYFRAIV